MALKPIATVKEDFVETTGKKTLILPKGPRVKKGSDEDASAFKELIFGPTGSGKTRTILGLLLHGLKVFVISTDIGGDGLASVALELKDMGRRDLLDNYSFVILNNYAEVETFLQNPAKIHSTIYDEDFDFLFWDGFTSFQQNVLAEEIGNMTPERSGGKEISEARESGLQFEQQDWGMVRNGTIRNLDKFLKLYNLKTGAVWHKIVTCLEDIKPVRTKTENGTVVTYQESKEPMLQGAAKKLIGPAFDLIINTKIVGTDDTSKRDFRYICAGHDTLSGAKTRGLKLDADMPGDMYALWGKIAEQKGIKRGAISQEFEVNENYKGE